MCLAKKKLQEHIESDGGFYSEVIAEDGCVRQYVTKSRWPRCGRGARRRQELIDQMWSDMNPSDILSRSRYIDTQCYKFKPSMTTKPNTVDKFLVVVTQPNT